VRSRATALFAGSSSEPRQCIVRFRWFVGTAVAIMLGLAFFGAVSAHAANSYQSAGSFSANVSRPRAVAIDDATSNVLLADPGSGVVLVTDSGGGLLTYFELPNAQGIAVDQTNGSVYVSCEEGILRYLDNGASPPEYTRDLTWVSPSLGSEPGQVGDYASRLAVDPTTGDLLVADRGNERVSRFDETGAFVSSFNGSDTATGPFTNLLDLTVAPSGEIYVLDLDGSIAPNGKVEGTSRVEVFEPNGASKARVGAGVVDGATSIAFDAARASLITASPQGTEIGPPILSILHDGVLESQVPYPPEAAHSSAPGLAVDNGATGRLYATTFVINGFLGPAAVQIFNPVIAPTLTLDPPSSASSTGAHLHGTVNPGGKPTNYRFEYSIDGGNNWIEIPEGDAGEGETPVSVEADLTGLRPNAEYEVRLEASNVEAVRTTAVRTFSTLLSSPGVVTAEAEVQADSATLRGTVNPFGLVSSYYFEFGPTATYGSRVPAGNTAPAGMGITPHAVEQLVSGLNPESEYHYRLVAENSAGVSFGDDRVLTTVSDAVPTRAYELVSPVDKGESNIDLYWSHATPSGNAITYQAKTAIPGPLTAAAPYFPRYNSVRGESDWATTGLDVLQERIGFGNDFFFDVLAVSEDQTKALVLSAKDLAPGGVDGSSNLYLKDVATGTLRLVATSPGLEFYIRARTDHADGARTVLGGTPDFSRVVFESQGSSFLPGASGEGVYEWAEGRLRLVAAEASEPGSSFSHQPNMVSHDGSTIFYRRTLASGQSDIMAQVGGTEDVPVSTEGAQELIGATPDGRFVFTLGGGFPQNLYRFDLDTRELSMLASDVVQQGGLFASENGEYVYYLGLDETIRLWHAGVNRVIAPNGQTLGHYQGSPDGRYFAFTSARDLTGDGTAGREEVYRYDAVTQGLTCVSCRAGGGRSTGNAALVGYDIAQFEHYYARSVLNNGEVFFDTPDPLVAADVNSNRDVYEFDGGRQILISAGTGAGASVFADASADGGSVFFTTPDRLVKADTDDAVDMYDARIGGGLPSQNSEPTATGGCFGAGCRASAALAPTPPAIGSESAGGKGNGGGKPHPKRCPKGSHLVKKKNGKQRCVKRAHGRKHHNRRAAR
jgi:sugar lactone lactonase YvrE